MDVAVTIKLTADEFQTLRTALKGRETDLRAEYKDAPAMRKSELRTELASLQFLIEKIG
jgi:hypothetical protein